MNINFRANLSYPAPTNNMNDNKQFECILVTVDSLILVNHTLIISHHHKINCYVPMQKAVQLTVYPFKQLLFVH